MLYSPQNALASGQFARLIGIISCVHIAILFVLFISEYLSQSRPIVMSMGGARVQMVPGRGSIGKGGGSRGPAPVAEQSVSSANQQVAETNKEPIAPVAEKKAPVKEQEVRKESPAQKTTQKPVAIPAPKKEAAKDKPAKDKPAKDKPAKDVVPGFSALKKQETEKPAYSALSKKEKSSEVSKVPVTSSTALGVSGAGFSALGKKQNEQPKKQESLTQAKTSSDTQQAQAASSTSGQPHNSGGAAYGGSQAGGHGSAAIETVEIHGDEPGWSVNEYSQEFFRYYSEPPGFKDREPMVITVEICDGKAIGISPRTSEPLILYTAAKDAILKMRFARHPYVEKKEFII